MRFVSTAGRSPAVDLRTALIEGLAPDGGLYLPERMAPIPTARIEGMKGRSLAEVAKAVAPHLLGTSISRPDLDRVVESALDFPVPLVRIEPETHVLELFHGPTLAFKDVGARFMAVLFERVCGERDGSVTVLVATSGDTGSAVAHAFRSLPRVRTVVLFPHGKVSPLQERQFTTLGGNVHAVEVDGTFDDCQRLVKAAFADMDLRERVPLTSANSINIGRLVPQVFYYFYAWAQLPGAEPPLFSVPSGNFGNLTAGLLAKSLGLPTRGFVAATNVNDVVPDYLSTGVFRPRASISTLSNAMDVGHPSNVARILALYGGDRELLQADVVGSVHDDADTRQAIREVHRRTGYVLDPHSAVGYLGLGDGRRAFGQGVSISLATAHPAKFREAVEPEIGVPVAVPDRLAACLSADRHVTRIAARLPELLSVLLDGAPT